MSQVAAVRDLAERRLQDLSRRVAQLRRGCSHSSGFVDGPDQGIDEGRVRFCSECGLEM